MTRDKRFLVGLSGTEHDVALIRYARRLADLKIGRQFDFVHVVQPETRPDEVAAVRERVEGGVRAAFGTTDGTAAAGRVVPGIRIDALITEAVRFEAGTILIGHRRTHSGRRSLARRLAMVSPCSVWMVPEGAAGTIQNILSPVDFSANSADAFRVAVGLARATGGCIRPLHVSFDPTVVRYEEHVAELRTNEMEQLAAFLAAIDTAGLSVVPQCEEGPDAARTSLRVAAETGADLIVMSTRGRSAAAAVLLGSVTARVIAESPVAVLAVKHYGAVLGLFEVLRERELWQHAGPKTS